MDSTDLDIRIQQLETQLSASGTSDDMDLIKCQLLNLRFLKELKILQQKAKRMKDEPTDMEILNKYFSIKF